MIKWYTRVLDSRANVFDMTSIRNERNFHFNKSGACYKENDKLQPE